jgi:hypothetical protein
LCNLICTAISNSDILIQTCATHHATIEYDNDTENKIPSKKFNDNFLPHFCLNIHDNIIKKF